MAFCFELLLQGPLQRNHNVGPLHWSYGFEVYEPRTSRAERRGLASEGTECNHKGAPGFGGSAGQVAWAIFGACLEDFYVFANEKLVCSLERMIKALALADE